MAFVLPLDSNISGTGPASTDTVMPPRRKAIEHLMMVFGEIVIVDITPKSAMTLRLRNYYVLELK